MRLALLIGGCVLLSASGAGASTGYVNPFSTPGYYVGRTDMGVDVCLNAGDPIAAIGNGVVVGIQPDWFEKEPYIWYQLTSGPEAGRYVYVAEQITRLVKVGQQLTAGQTIATYAKKGTCIETGWSAANGATLAQSTTGYHEGEVTTAGISFAHLLISVGVQGNFELTVPKAQTASKKRAKKTTTTATTTKTATTTRTTTTTKVATTSNTTTRTPTTTKTTFVSGGGGLVGSGGTSSGGAGWS